MSKHRDLISILVVDDHPIIRRGLKTLLTAEKNITHVDEAETFAESLDFLKKSKQKPNLVIIDLSLSDSSGIELTRKISTLYPSIHCLILSMHDEKIFSNQAIHAGAKGYVMKSDPPETIIKAITQILSGRVYFSDEAAQRFLAKNISGDEKGITKLSPREKEVLSLIAMGYKNKMIAEKLNINSKTVNTYKENMKSKLGVESSSLLVNLAIQSFPDLKHQTVASS